MKSGTASTGRLAARARSGLVKRSYLMLWTILVVLAIIALVLYILGRVRGGA